MTGDHALQPQDARGAALTATGSMVVDTSQVVHIPRYVPRILLLLAISFVFFAIGLWWMMNPEREETSLIDQVIMVLGTVLFGGGCGLFSYILFFGDDYPVVVSPSGLTISFHSRIKVEWKHVIGLKSLSIRGGKIVLLELDRPAVNKPNRLTRLLRKWSGTRRFWASIQADFLDVRHNELIDLLQAYWQAHGKMPATPGLNPRTQEG